MCPNYSRIKSSSFQRRLTHATLAIGLSISLLACGGKTAEEHIEQAKAFVQSGDNQAAVVELKNAIQQAPRQSEARFQLGKIYLEIKDYESAEKELSRALELGYPAAQVIPLLSQAYQRTGANVALADLNLEEAGLTAVERLEVGYRKLQSLLQLEKNDDAQILIEDLLLIDSVSVYKGLIEGIEMVLNEDLESALNQAIELKERAPLNRDVLNFAARMYIITGQQVEAVKVYEDYIRVAPDDIEVKFALTNMLVELGESQRAEKYIDELMAINDQNGLLNQLKGITRAAAGDHEAALAFSERAIQNGFAQPTVRLVAGYAAYQLAEYEKAVGHLSFVAEFLPDNHPGLRILAASQLQANMGDQTDEVLSRLDDLTSADASLFSRTGYELLRAGDEEGAKEIIAQAEKISETADDLTRLGILKLSINDIEGMLNLEQAVEKAPESITAKTTLASAYIATNQLDKAMALAKEWQQQSPAAVEGYLLQAEVEQRREDFDSAMATLDKVSELDADNLPVQVSKIRLYLRKNDLDEALSSAEQLLDKAPDNIVALAAIFAVKSQRGEALQAQQMIERSLQAHPNDMGIKLLAARAALVNNQGQKALDALEGISADREAPAQFWPLKGTALLRMNRVNDAERHYQLWSEDYPKHENAVLGQLLILDGKRDYQKALDVAEDFLSKENNLQISFIRAYLLTMLNRVDEAKTAMAAIDEQYKALPFLRGVNARIAILENRPAEAENDALAAYEANSNLNNMLVLLRAYDLTQQTNKSYALIEQHASNNPQDVRALMLLGERQIAKDPSLAKSTYEQILALTPDNFVVLNNLAYLLKLDGDLDRAEQLSKRAYEIQPSNAAAADTYAQVLLRKNQIKEAIEIYNRAITDDVNSDEILLNYIETLLLNGDTAIAKRRLQRHTFNQAGSAERIENLKQSYNL